MTRSVKTLGEAARHGMLVRVTCRKCDKVGFFIASDLATVNGDGRIFKSPKFRCNFVDCEVMPFEDDRDRVHKKRTVWRPWESANCCMEALLDQADYVENEKHTRRKSADASTLAAMPEP